MPIKRRGVILKIKLLGRSTVEICYHALRQMEIRGITQAQVLDTLRSPHEQGLPTDMFRLRVRRHYGPKKSIDVIYEHNPDRVLVVTAIKIDRERGRK